ncbi:MAG: hypothetical protein K2X47_18230, partial [Bdellovibrionales bacterium]|nr:hypothetical protein [Bdellovibrionales bacterium]
MQGYRISWSLGLSVLIAAAFQNCGNFQQTRSNETATNQNSENDGSNGTPPGSEIPIIPPLPPGTRDASFGTAGFVDLPKR